MADNTFTIGAVVDVSQMAKIAAAGQLTKESIDGLTGSFTEASAASARAVSKISDDTKAAALTVGQNWKDLTSASLAYTAALKEVSGATYLARKAGEDDAGATALLAAAKQKAAAASLQMAEAEAALGTATGHSTEENIAARLVTDTLTGNFARADQALIRFASHTDLVGPAIQAAFVPFAIATFAEILFRAGEKAYHLYENIILLKGSIEALEKADAAAAEKSASFNYQYEESVARRLQAQGKFKEAEAELKKAEADKPLDLLKIDDKNFKQFNSDFVTFMQSVHTTSEAPTVLTRIAAEAAASRKDLEEQEALKKKLEEPMPGDLGTDAGNVLATTNVDKKIEDIKDKINLLNAAANQIRSQTGIAAEAEATRAADLAKKAEEEAKKEEELALRRSEMADRFIEAQARMAAERQKIAERMAQIQTDENDFFQRSEEKRAEQAGKAELKQIMEASQQRVKLQELDVEQARISGVAKVQVERQNVQTEFDLHRINAVQRIALLKQLLDDEYEIERTAIEKKIVLMQQDPAISPDKIKELQNKIENLTREHNAKLAALTTEGAKESQQKYDQFFSKVNSGFTSSLNGILTGTKTFARGMQELWSSLALDVIDSIAKIGLKWVEQHLLMRALSAIFHTQQVAEDTAAQATQLAVHSAGNVAEATSDAGLAAAGTFAWWSGVNPIIAPAMAEAAFVEGLGFAAASASGGAFLSQDMPLFAHKDEMVLPAPLSLGFKDIIGRLSGGSASGTAAAARSGSGGDFGKSSSMTTNYGDVHISAFDGKSVADMIHRNQGAFTRAAASMVRNGWRPR